MQARRRSWVFAAVALVSTTTVGSALAEPPTKSYPPSEVDASLPEGAPDPSAEKAADVVLAGPAASSRELADLIEELLRAAAVTPRFLRVSGMERNELLDAASRPSSGHARVWVTLSGPELALLLFAGPSRERYLVRQVPLRSGLDELGRERIAQVIQSSTLALLHGTTGMTRAEMRQAVQQAGAAPRAEPIPSHSPPTAAPVEPKDSRPQHVRSRPQAAPRVGLGYAASWTGDTLGTRHGPLARLGLDRIGSTPLSVGLTFESDFGQKHETSQVGVETQTRLVRLMLGGEWPLGGSLALFAGVAGGLDVTRVRARPASDGTVLLRSEATYTTLAGRVEAGIEVQRGAFVLSIGLRVDASPSKTHYDLVRGGTADRVATPWPLFPGLGLAGAWRPLASTSGGS